jgi:hypothetical protein
MDQALGPESGGQITVSAGCNAGLVEDNTVEHPYMNTTAIVVDAADISVLERRNKVFS